MTDAPFGRASTVESQTPSRSTDGRGSGVARNWTAFVLIGLVLYGCLYAASEQLIYHYARRNRFFMVKTAPHSRFDYLVLGASHAAVFDYGDMNARLEQTINARVLNLSTVGGGVYVNRLLLDYFLASHETATILYVVDSFAFYSPQWNEGRLKDAKLFLRAPLDGTLAGLLLRNPATRSVGLGYLSGFAKINNPDRFRPDAGDEEATRFDRTYRPVAQIDRERLEYLYATPIDVRSRQRYFQQFEDILGLARTRGIAVAIVRPPIPARVHRLIPDEARFDRDLTALAIRYGVQVHDFSAMCNDGKFFFDTDHLNRAGVANFYEQCLRGALVAPSERRTP